MMTGCCETSLLFIANARRTGTLLIIECPVPGTHCQTNTRGLPGGMPAVRIDPHIIIDGGQVTGRGSTPIYWLYRYVPLERVHVSKPFSLL